jgi:hypothetical protein
MRQVQPMLRLIMLAVMCPRHLSDYNRVLAHTLRHSRY